MRFPWQSTYTYSASDLKEYLSEIRSDTFTGGWMLKRDVLLQAQEMGLVKLPNNIMFADAHRIVTPEITFIEPPPQNFHQKHA